MVAKSDVSYRVHINKTEAHHHGHITQRAYIYNIYVYNSQIENAHKNIIKSLNQNVVNYNEKRPV